MEIRLAVDAQEPIILQPANVGKGLVLIVVARNRHVLEFGRHFGGFLILGKSSSLNLQPRM